MAAYAALCSVIHIIDQIKHHPRPPISLDENQAQTLIEKVTFFQDFLEVYSHVRNEEADRLQSRIAEAAYAAEDVIESHVVDQILAQSAQSTQSTTHPKRISANVRRPSNLPSHLRKKRLPHRGLSREKIPRTLIFGDNILERLSLSCQERRPCTFFQDPRQICATSSSSVDFYEGLQKVIGDMDLIKKDVMEIKEKMGSAHDIQLHTSGSSRSPLKDQNIMVGFDDVLIQLLDKLTGEGSNRQIITIVGMGGIGKTTLAKHAYENKHIVLHFDICVWVTISQEYSMKEILVEVISCLKDQENEENLKELHNGLYEEELKGRSEEELGVELHKSLYDRRYLIVMDDMWSIEAWNKVKFFLPDNNNGSRVIITTRLSNIALHLPSASRIEMNFLDEKLSWNLLCKIVFGAETGCPLELKEIGKKIAKNCKGLPLSIVVIGGLLAKSKWKTEHWKDIVENLNSIVNLEDNEHCFQQLYMSYNHLPVHLKPCFLYMGVLPEDKEIRVSNLIKTWVAEGFLKPIIGKSLEEAAEEYLNNLIDRNLILIHKRKSNGKIKSCKIHDLVRDLCLREVQKENFLWVTEQHSFYNFSQTQGINAKRRIVINQSTLMEENRPKTDDASNSPSLARSLICRSPMELSSFNFRLLRLVALRAESLEYTLFQRFNLRYLHVQKLPRTFSSFNLLWNLQTLVVRRSELTIKIWDMPLLRHVKVKKLFLPDPSNDFSSYSLKQNKVVLENLQTLSNVENFWCSERMVMSIPNIKKLRISYPMGFGGSRYCLNNLACLHKLESLNLLFRVWLEPSRRDLMQNLIFPHSLKKLTLQGSNLHWEDISTKIGSLPHLQLLKLRRNSFRGRKWDTVEGQFLSLKILLIDSCSELEQWTTDRTHFPCLEHLVLIGLYKLKKIPSSIGEIPTLQSIELNRCSDSAIFSAYKIEKEQEQLGNESLRVLVKFSGGNQVLLSSASHHFRVKN